jgi:hypothetical protein
MGVRRLFLYLPVLALLAACAKTDEPVRLDFVSGTTLTSGSRNANTTDTLTTRAYAVANDQVLKRLLVTVTYSPGLSPINYPTPVSSFDPKNAPAEQTITYADTLLAGVSTNLTRPGEFLFINPFIVRATSGTETWTYTATDATEQTGSRRIRLISRNPDSARVYQYYSLRLRPVPRAAAVPASVRDRSPVFLNMRYGLALPKFAVLNNTGSLPDNQRLIDLVCLASRGGAAITLVAPAADTASIRLPLAKWLPANRRATEIRAVGLTAAQFTNAASAADFATVFAAGTALNSNSYNSGPLVKDQVVAFRTSENGQQQYGLLQVTAITTGSAAALTIQVKVEK